RAGERVDVLEVGSGQGTFCKNLLRVLEVARHEEPRALAKRLRYVLSDYSEKSLREAIQQPLLARHVASGVVVPALLDLRRPGALTDLEGRPLAVRLVATWASYICCATPAKVFQKTRDGFEEKHVRIRVRLGGDGEAPPADALLAGLLEQSLEPELMKGLDVSSEWRPVSLEAALDARHARSVRETLADFEEGTLVYPHVFLDFARALGERKRPGGLLLVSDFGVSSPEDLRGRKPRDPVHYGNTISQGVNFPLFDAFARTEGLALARTRSAFASLH